MNREVFHLGDARIVTNSGTNVYPRPEYHPDRIMAEHDLLYIVDGEMKVSQDDDTYTLHSGDIITLFAGCHHWGPALCSVNCRTMFIHMNRIAGDRHNADFSMPETEAASAGASILLPTCFHCGDSNRIEEIFQEINHVFWSRRSDKNRVLALLCNLLLCELSHVARKTQLKSDPWTVQLLRELNNDLSKNVSLEDIAKSAGMSVRTASERFRSVTGKSIHQYQLNLRLEAAYNTLREEGRSVKEVSAMYGFCDQYYFSKVFKQKFGHSPSEVRSKDPWANMHRYPVD